MEARLKVDTLLREVLKENGKSIHLYFQPKAGFQLQYPCIVYSETRIRNNHANNSYCKIFCFSFFCSCTIFYFVSAYRFAVYY